MQWHKKTTLLAIFGVASLGMVLVVANNATRPAIAAQAEAAKLALRNQTQYGYKGEISGTVRFANGTPASGFRVQARFVHHATGAPGEGYAITDFFGNYSIRGLTDHQGRFNTSVKGVLGDKNTPDTVEKPHPLPQAVGVGTEFRVFVENEGKPFLSRVVTRPITLTPSKNVVTKVDFVLVPGPEITVRVRDAETGAPVPGLPVEANPAEWSSPQAVGVTNQKGEFVYHSPTRQNELRIAGDKQPNPAVDVAPGSSFYYRQTLEPDKHFLWDIRTYSNPQIPKSIVFRGVLRDRHGKPLKGVPVRLLKDASAYPQTATNSKGAFSFPMQRIEERSDRSGTVLLFDKGQESMVRFVRAADTWQQLDLVWNPSETATVSGRVVDSEGKPLANVSVYHSATFANPQFPSDPGGSRGVFSNGDGGMTDTNGQFTIHNLHPEAAYYFTLARQSQGGNLPPLALTYIPEPAFKGVFIRLRPNENRDLGTITVRRADKTVAGILVNDTGKPVHQNILLVAYGKHTETSTSPLPDGSFKIKGLVDEPIDLLIVYGDGSGAFGYTQEKITPPYRVSVKAGDTNLRIVAPPQPPKP